jgi:tetratricopeptide (TPR) repeat protein
VDRRHLADLLHEQDIKIMNSEQAVQSGKLANVQGMIYGNVHVQYEDQQLTREVFDIMSRGTKTKQYTKRYCQVVVNLTMDNVDTGKPYHVFSRTKDFDSDRDSGESSFAKTLGFSQSKPEPVSQTAEKLLNLVVSEFIADISPHREVLKVVLEKGMSKAVDSGNKLAKTGDYAGALEDYQSACREKPEDDGAVFNAGVMYEVQGDLARAEQQYLKAFRMNAKDKYASARQRARVEGKTEKDEN